MIKGQKLAADNVPQLVKKFTADLELWQDEQGIAYVTMSDGKNIKVQSREMRDSIRLFKPSGSNTTRQSMLELIETQARQGPIKPIYRRVSNEYLDLGTKYINLRTLQAESKVNQKFIRTSNQATLPDPDFNGTLDDLTDLLTNIKSEEQVLIKGALIAAFKPTVPYFITVLGGRQGSAKTTTQRMLISCIDPQNGGWEKQTTLLESRDPRDLDALALSRYALSVDNLWTLSSTFSNRLAVYATGGEIASRQYYTNTELNTASVHCPIFLNGIGELLTQSDTLSRAIIVMCELPEHKLDDDVIEEFYKRRPRILGAILKHVQRAILEPKKVYTGDRMSSVVSWIVSSGLPEFEYAYSKHLHEIDERAIELSPVGIHLRELVSSWTNGRYAFRQREIDKQEALRNELRIEIPESCYVLNWHELYEDHKDERDWPNTETKFVNAKNYIRKNLNNIGIDWQDRKAASGFVSYTILGMTQDLAKVKGRE